VREAYWFERPWGWKRSWSDVDGESGGQVGQEIEEVVRDCLGYGKSICAVWLQGRAVVGTRVGRKHARWAKKRQNLEMYFLTLKNRFTVYPQFGSYRKEWFVGPKSGRQNLVWRVKEYILRWEVFKKLVHCTSILKIIEPLCTFFSNTRMTILQIVESMCNTP
jgi:hypothetical protein